MQRKESVDERWNHLRRSTICMSRYWFGKLRAVPMTATQQTTSLVIQFDERVRVCRFLLPSKLFSRSFIENIYQKNVYFTSTYLAQNTSTITLSFFFSFFYCRSFHSLTCARSMCVLISTSINICTISHVFVCKSTTCTFRHKRWY